MKRAVALAAVFLFAICIFIDIIIFRGDKIKSRKTMPEGYKKSMTIDLLNDKKPMLTVCVINLVLLILTFSLGFLFSSFKFNFWLILSVPLIYIYMLLHEFVHGIFMYSFSNVKPSYGFNLAYAYAGSTAYFSKVHYIIIALSPIVIWGIVLAVICYFTVDTKFFWMFYLVECVNISGAAGDIYVTFLFSKLPKNILVNDTGIKMTVYTKE